MCLEGPQLQQRERERVCVCVCVCVRASLTEFVIFYHLILLTEVAIRGGMGLELSSALLPNPTVCRLGSLPTIIHLVHLNLLFLLLLLLLQLLALQ